MKAEPAKVLLVLRTRAAEETGIIDRREGGKATVQAADGKVAATGSVPWDYLLRRAEALRDHLPPPPAWQARAVRLRKVLPLLPVVALVVGVLSHWAGLSRRFDLLGGPMLAVLGWNLLMYFVLLIRGALVREAATRLPGWLRPRQGADVGRSDFAVRQQELALPWLAPGASRGIAAALHLSAACLAVGLVGAIYLRGLTVAYEAGWESTWLGGEVVGAILGTLLAPAAFLTGFALPGDASGWEALRFGADPQPAAPWIHLHALTLVGVVILPRLLLAACKGGEAWRALHRWPDWEMTDGYVVGLVRASRMPGGREPVTVAPYGWRHPDILEDAARRAGMEGELSPEGCVVRWLPGASYGDEPDALEDRWGLRALGGRLVLYFDGTATPEGEVHGRLAGALRDRLPSGQVTLAVDLSGLPDARREGRARLWGEILGTDILATGRRIAG